MSRSRMPQALSTFIFEDKQLHSRRSLHVVPAFTMNTLLYLQETGELTVFKPNVSRRTGLKSYLFLMVEKGSGYISCGSSSYELKSGDCAFIDCSKPYSHSSDKDLWTLRWAHFHGCSADALYKKYLENGGKIVFTPRDPGLFHDMLAELIDFEPSAAFVTDLAIHEKLTGLIGLIYKQGIQRQDTPPTAPKRQELLRIKAYLEEHCTESISLDKLAAAFYINKYYLSHIFKEEFGTSINNYLGQLRIIMAKKHLRFTDWTVEKVGAECGYGDVNYFIRVFKKREGMTPSEYRSSWKN